MSNSTRSILLVDDDDALRSTLAEQLVLLEDFDTTEADSGTKALTIAKERNFDAVILDVGLPDMDGRDLCRLLRRQGVSAPIIMLTGHDTDADAILGLDAGATDYVTKPFKLNVLMARLRAHMRHFEAAGDAVFTVGPYTFQPSNRVLIRRDDGQEVRLTEKECAILKHLHKAGDKVVPRETLLGEVWGYNSSVNTHTLETHIYRLRQKIEADPSNASLLVTRSGGYLLVSGG
ncbi:MAG: response regulator transcription factor [Alphaproteobacteria bacterium]